MLVNGEVQRLQAHEARKEKVKTRTMVFVSFLSNYGLT